MGRTNAGALLRGFPCWGEARSSTASRSFLKPRLGVTRTSGQSLPNRESRHAACSTFPAPTIVTQRSQYTLLAFVCFLLATGPTLGDELQLGGLRVFNQGRDLRLVVLRPKTNTVYELQTAPTLAPGVIWTRAQLGHLGQTNFIVALPSNAPAFFRLRIPPLSGPAQLTLPEDTPLGLSPVRIHLPEGLQSTLTLDAVAGVLAGPNGAGGSSLRWLGAPATLQDDLDLTRYVPPTNFHGKDRIRFELAFTNGAPTERLDMELVVTPVNDPPIAMNDSFYATENSTLFIPSPGVLSNDIEVEAEPLSARLAVAPEHGSLAFDVTGSFVYLPEPEFRGVDRFSYIASDGANESAPASVEIYIAPAGTTASAHLASPASGSRFTEGVDIGLELYAPAEIAWQRVDYYRASNLVATASAPPFGSTWLNASKGTHTLRAQCWQTSGRSIWTDAVTIEVEPDCDRDGISDAVEIARGQDPCAELNQQEPQLTVLDGDVQTGQPGTNLPQPLRARLTTRHGVALTNRTVRFVTEEGAARVATAPDGPWRLTESGVTDASGVALVWVLLPLTPGVSLIRATGTNGGAQAQVSFIVTAFEEFAAWRFENTPIAMAAGAEHTLALLADGMVLRWGRNEEGQLGVDPARLPFQPQPELWPGVSNVIAIAAGGHHSLLLKDDGTVWTAGEYLEHERAFVPPGLADVVAIAAGQDHGLALLANGTVRAWGDSFSNHQPPPGVSGVGSIAAGLGFSVASKTDGTVLAWGSSSYHPNFGQTVVPAGLRDVRAVSAGGFHALVLRTNGTVAGWGANDYGQSTVPPTLDRVVALAAGFNHSVALQSDGTVVAWGDNRFGQLGQLTDLPDVIAISAGGGSGPSHSLALRADGSLWSWGANGHGQLGNGGLSSSSLPRLVSLPPSGTITEDVAFELHTPLQ